MAITPMTEDVEIIQKLSTYPNKDDNLTAEGLKEKFDTAAVSIKRYINNTLVPTIQGIEDHLDIDTGVVEAVDSLADLRILAENHVCTLLDNSGKTIGVKLDTDDLSEGGELRIFKGIDGNGTQAAHVTLTCTDGSVLRITGYNEGNQSNPAWAWESEWSWENPPMRIGVEYKTTERWQKKPIYTKIVDMGEMPDNVKSVAHNCDATAIVRCAGTMSDGHSLPIYDYYAVPDSTRYAVVNANKKHVIITTNTWYANRTAVAQIWYTKD